MLKLRQRIGCAIVEFLLLSLVLICPVAVPAAERTDEDEKPKASSTTSQTVRPSSSAYQVPQVAVVDIARLEKEHNRLRAAIEDLKKEREANLAELQRDAGKIDRLQKQLEEFEEDSEEHRELTEKLGVAQAVLAAKRLNFTEEDQRQEAKIYFQFHGEVTAEIRNFAQRYGIHLVIPYDSSDVGPEDSKEEILHRMKTVPLYQSKIDITDYLLHRMNPPYPNRVRAFPTPR